MNEDLKISVVVATKNRCASLQRMLDNILSEGYPNLEIVVADGGSTDGTVELLKSYGDKIARWISEADKGEYDGYRKSLSMATGDIIKFMTDDDVLRPGSLQLAAEHFATHPKTGILFGHCVILEKRGEQCFAISSTDLARSPDLSFRGWLRDKQQVVSPTAFVRRLVFDQIGGLSTEYAVGDWEFWLRASANNIRMEILPNVVMDYYITGDNGTITRKWRMARDKMKVIRKYGTPLDMVSAVARIYMGVALAAILDGIGIHPRRKYHELMMKLNKSGMSKRASD